jgi:hypothetical protein
LIINKIFNIILFRSQVFNNSNKHRFTGPRDLTERSASGYKTNDDLPAPQKILTGAARTQPGRFGAVNQSSSVAGPTNEQPPRFPNFHNRNQQQQQSQTIDSTPPNSGWNKDQNNKPNFSSSSGTATQQTFGRQPSGPSQFGNTQKTEDFKITIPNNATRYSSTNYDNQQQSEQKRSFGREIND